MFFKVVTFRNKDGSTRSYLHLAESVREGKRTRHKILCTLGRLELLKASGTLDRMADALAKLAERETAIDLAKEMKATSAQSFGPVPIFSLLWKKLGLPSAIADATKRETFFGYDVNAALFRMVLGRLLSPASKLSTHRWAEKIFWNDGEKVELQHYYRALGVLARNVKKIEENLFFHGRDLFTPAPDLLFFDTTSVYFEGEGPVGELARFGFSKDHRPDRRQMIVGVVLTREGTPLAHHVFPGNTPDASAFSRVIEDMRNRFGIRRVILVGDRGMFNATVIGRIEELGMEYIAGVRMRTVKEVREVVLADKGSFKPVAENLAVKEVRVNGKRYIVCRNEEEERRARAVREQVVVDLKEKIAQGPKGLIGNSAYRKFLSLEKGSVVLDEQRIAADATYDGRYVLTTNTVLGAKEAALAYKGLWQVERAFREIKSAFEIRPVYLSREDHVRGHVALCFLAFCLETAFVKAVRPQSELPPAKKEPAETNDGEKEKLREQRKAREVEWRKALEDLPLEEIMRRLCELRVVELAVKEKRYRVITEPDKVVTAVFRLLGTHIPQRVTEILPEPTAIATEA